MAVASGVHHQVHRGHLADDNEGTKRIAILDLIPDFFPTGGGASALFSARENSFIKAHAWLLALGLGLIMLLLAVFAKPFKFALQTSNRVVWAVLGVLCLIIALLFAVGLVHV